MNSYNTDNANSHSWCVRNLDKFEFQKMLVAKSISENIAFKSVLASYGMSYDDLQYENSSKPTLSKHKPVELDQVHGPNHQVPMVSFFSGAGGLDLGFEAAGYNHIALFEHNELFCKTLKHNRPEWSIFGPPSYSGDVSKTDELIDQLQALIPRNFEGVFAGGPPCQPFSIAANQRFNKNGNNFKRVGFSHETNGSLLFDYIKLIEHFLPHVFVVENVTGLLGLDNGIQLRQIYQRLSNSGYYVHDPMVLSAAHYGIAQNRTRLFIIGARANRQILPPDRLAQVSCGHVFERNALNAKNHVTRMHNATSIDRYMRLEYGSRDQLGRVDRLDPALPSKTVIAGGTKGGGRSHLHPYIPRTISVREGARLQTFPDEYEFSGPVARQFTQVGNAVPPVLAALIGRRIFEAFYG